MGFIFPGVQYEHLVTDLEISRQIIEYYGLEWSEACLNFYKNKRVVGTGSYNQVNRPIYTI